MSLICFGSSAQESIELDESCIVAVVEGIEVKCKKATEDTFAKADEFSRTNSNAVPFTKIQACIAEKICMKAKNRNLDDLDWGSTVVPKFINRFINKAGNWQDILDRCKNPPVTSLHIIFPAPIISKEWCARIMAQQHIENDLGDALMMTGEQFGKPFRGCGTDDDWDSVFKTIEDCIPVGKLFDPLGFAESEVKNRRNTVRANCLKKAGVR